MKANYKQHEWLFYKKEKKKHPPPESYIMMTPLFNEQVVLDI